MSTTVAIAMFAAGLALTIASGVTYYTEYNCRAAGRVWVTSPRDGQHACLPYNALVPAR